MTRLPQPIHPILALCAALLALAGGCASYGTESRGISHSGVPGSAIGRSGFNDEIGLSGPAGPTGPAFLAALDPVAYAATRMVARNATLSIELPVQNDADGETDRKATQQSIEEAAKAAAGICTQLKGWVVYESMNRVVLRIPSESLDTALEQIGALGDVTAQTVTGTDVTDQHRDNGIRLDNLEKSRQRYLKLLEAAEDVKAALSVEKELQRVTLAIERLKGQQKSLETSIAFSLVTVGFSGAYPPKAKPTPGPLGWVFYGLWWFVKWLFVWE
jgi:hypothetical protein